MAKASNNEFPSVLFEEQASTPDTPGSGLNRLFFDSSDGKLKYVDDAGSVTEVGAGGSGGDVTLIASEILASDTATVSFTSIASTFRDLKLVCYVRSAASVDNDTLRCRFGTGGGARDTGSNYDTFSWAFDDGGSAAFTEDQGTTSGRLSRGAVAAANDPSNVFSSAVVEIPAYRGGGFKVASANSGKASSNATAGTQRVAQSSVLWRNTGAIDSIDIFAHNGDLATGSEIRLYGLGS